MKIRNCMALICAVVALSACGRTVIVREGNSSEGTSSAVIEPVAVGKKTAKEKIDLSGLSHDKVGYGQGVLVDEKNRTTGALDFNAQYGKLNAKAINNDDKIYLTFDQGYENGYTEKILDVLKGARMFSEYDIAPIMEQIREKQHILIENYPDEFGPHKWSFDLDEWMAEEYHSGRPTYYSKAITEKREAELRELYGKRGQTNG